MKYFNEKAPVDDWRRYGNNPKAAYLQASLAAFACTLSDLRLLQDDIKRTIEYKFRQQVLDKKGGLHE